MTQHPLKLTASTLFASANGIINRSGNCRCLFCGAPCDGGNTSAEWLKSGFTAIASLARPGSQAVCDGCVAAMQTGRPFTSREVPA